MGKYIILLFKNRKSKKALAIYTIQLIMLVVKSFEYVIKILKRFSS